MSNNNTPFRGKRGFMAALLGLLAAGVSRTSEEYKSTQKRGFRHGKHNGRASGAFGGKAAAKAHRTLYVNGA